MQYLSTSSTSAEDPQLAKVMVRGVAFHNSGLSPGDRGLVERAFLSGRYINAVSSVFRSDSPSWRDEVGLSLRQVR